MENDTCYSQNSIIILLRGHVRTSFDDDKLYNIIKKISEKYSVKLYIHTWNKKSSNISWRYIQEDNTVITEDKVKNYFRDIPIKKIIIEDDSNVILNGKLDGNVMCGSNPLIGWKFMWYGINVIMNEIKLNENDKELIFNTRLDCFVDENAIFEFINNNIKTSKLKKNVFLVNQTDNLYGSDNVYIGDINVMSELIDHFYKNLDSARYYLPFYNFDVPFCLPIILKDLKFDLTIGWLFWTIYIKFK
jgi:hypothetical protein